MSNISTVPLRRSQRKRKPVDRYTPEHTTFEDDHNIISDDDDVFTSEEEMDEQPTAEDLAFIDNRPIDEILADKYENSESEENASTSEAYTTETEDSDYVCDDSNNKNLKK